MAFQYPPPILPEPSIPWITPPPFPPPTHFNVPPPPFSVPPPTWSQPGSSTYLQSNLPAITPPNHDEIWLNAWLCRRIIPTSAKRTLPLKRKLKIFETKGAIYKCVGILKQLNKSRQKLCTDKERIMNVDWQTEVDFIHNKKAELSQYLEMLSDPQVLEELKWTLRKRVKKRKSQKQRKILWQEHKAVIRDERNLRQQTIDKWLEDMQQSVETAKLEESLKVEADAVLSDVTYKKSEARRQLAMLSALEKLRQLRTQVASTRGEHVSLELSECFSSVIEKLKSLWNDKLEEHSLEEKRLRVLLTEAVDERKVSYDKTVLAQWTKLLFGSSINVHPFYLTAESNVENFIAIRRSWDKCLTTLGTAMSSGIPVGWVLPTNPSSVEWESVLTAETID